MTLEEYLLKETAAGDVVVIRIGGWISGATYIDHEDLFIYSQSDDIKNRKVVNSEWGMFKANARQNMTQMFDVKYIDVEV